MGFEQQMKSMLNELDLSNAASCELVLNESARLHAERVASISFLSPRDRRVLRETGLSLFNVIFQKEDAEGESACGPRLLMYRSLIRSRATGMCSRQCVCVCECV
jgi:hypothetical protein